MRLSMTAILAMTTFGIGCDPNSTNSTDKITENDVSNDGSSNDTDLLQDLDLDGDGYLASEECDDSDVLINPSAVEVCDGIDNNCDGQIDEGVTTRFYWDNDEDNFGNPNESLTACSAPEGFVTVGNDCNDDDPAIYPSAPEQCNEIDDDCDEEIDEGLIVERYYDGDGDGFGDSNQPSFNCIVQEGYVFYGGDCDDANPDIHPYQQELCNNIDDDCDGETDEGANQYYFLDMDEDGFGDPNSPWQSCDAPANYVTNNDDCDDGNSAIHPNGNEYCNGLDEDCDGVLDNDSLDAPTWYFDIDGDGYGSAFIVANTCTMPLGYYAEDLDCDDTRAQVYPGAQEYCNDLDDDCNGAIDDNAFNALTWYHDADNDDFGDPNDTLYECDQPFDYIPTSGDCDDGIDTVFPGSEEVCNGLDDDCNGVPDDNASDALEFFLDFDGDGFGDPSIMEIACTAPAGYVLDDTDCDDTDGSIFPGAQEYCDGIDQNCDGNNFYELDLDNDGLLACEESVWIRNSASNSTSPYGACSQAAGYLLNQKGLTVNDMYHGNTPITSAFLENFGLYVHHGNNMNGALGAYTNSEATALEDWVYNGGRLLFIGFHSTQEACEASNSIPFQFGVSCDNVYYSWNGTTSNFVSHPITDGLGSVGGLGGENWVVTAPAQVLASVGQYEFLVVVEHGAGKVVLIADEWPYYNPNGGGYHIGYGSNRQMVYNIWEWLLEQS